MPGVIDFERRRYIEPQAVIDDLVGQTARQAEAIGQLNAKVARLERELTELTRPPAEEINKRFNELF